MKFDLLFIPAIMFISALLLIYFIKRYYIRKMADHTISGEQRKIPFSLNVNDVFWGSIVVCGIIAIVITIYQYNLTDLSGEKQKKIERQEKVIDSLNEEVKASEKEIRRKIYNELTNQ